MHKDDFIVLERRKAPEGRCFPSMVWVRAVLRLMGLSFPMTARKMKNSGLRNFDLSWQAGVTEAVLQLDHPARALVAALDEVPQ